MRAASEGSAHQQRALLLVRDNSHADCAVQKVLRDPVLGRLHDLVDDVGGVFETFRFLSVLCCAKPGATDVQNTSAAASIRFIGAPLLTRGIY